VSLGSRSCRFHVVLDKSTMYGDLGRWLLEVVAYELAGLRLINYRHTGTNDVLILHHCIVRRQS